MALLTAAVLAAASCAAPENSPAQSQAQRQALADAVVANWAGNSAVAARALIDKYGCPDAVESHRLTWWNRGPWKRTTVWEQTPLYASDDLPVIEQAVYFPIVASDAERLRQFNGEIEFDMQSGELVSQSMREETNFLNLNLAYDIIAGRKTIEQARQDYLRLLELGASGKTSAYMSGLLFSLGR